jgi:hypothetical protein
MGADKSEAALQGWRPLGLVPGLVPVMISQ